MDKRGKEPLHKSFRYALEGIAAALKKERNMKIHCCAMILVVMAGTILHIPAWKWCVCFCLSGLVMALELVNTAVEAVVDLVTQEKKPLAKLAKDAAAGAVLAAAAVSVLAALIMFVPEGIRFLQDIMAVHSVI